MMDWMRSFRHFEDAFSANEACWQQAGNLKVIAVSIYLPIQSSRIASCLAMTNFCYGVDQKLPIQISYQRKQLPPSIYPY